RVVARRSHPDLVGGSDIGYAVGSGVDVAAVPALERLFIHGADALVGAVADVNDSVANIHATRTLRALAAIRERYLLRRKALDLMNLLGPCVNYIDRPDVDGGNPDRVGVRVIGDVVVGDVVLAMRGKMQNMRCVFGASLRGSKRPESECRHDHSHQ